MSRLTDLTDRMPHAPTPSTRGCGFKMWETRRANKFIRDVKVLTAGVDNPGRPDRAVWHLAADAASEFLAAHLPDSATSLPRGYSVVENSIGQRAIARAGVLLNPGYSEPPDDGAIEQFARDLKTGLLAEIEAFLEAAEG
jgi:hypothetical protein